MLKNFFKCGLIGWCMEIIFTALDSFRRRDMRLMGQTSLWMFPIYGSACLLSLLFKPLKRLPAFVRGSVYALCIYIGEYLTGALLSKHKICPWDYEKSRWNIKRVIRLDYFPNWFLAGLLFEKVLSKKQDISDNSTKAV
ncbi:MAG: putative ABC transporter permease [Lachnospiraceae bacterium]|nr:putative ABC transporter permease [Lachnospiraceae bacterium]